MKIIKYECRPNQLRSTVYDVLIFNNEENWSILQKAYSLHYDQAFREYNKYVFFPVQREKWNGSPDAPQNLKTLVASADVLLRAVPSTAEKDLFVAGFFEDPKNFESVKRELKEFIEECYEISSKNYYTYIGEQIRLDNSCLLDVLDKSQLKVANGYIDKVKSGDMSYNLLGEMTDQLLTPEQQEIMSNTVTSSLLGGSYNFIRWDINILLQDFDFASDSYAPKFQVVICGKRKPENGVSGKYDIYLKRNGVMDEHELYFSTRHAKALYIYFLIHASEKYNKEQIDKEQLIKIYHEIYGVSNEFRERLSGVKIIRYVYVEEGKKEEKKADEEKGIPQTVRRFDAFIKDTKPSVNRTVQAALKGVYDYSKMKTEENKKKPFRDAEKWYTIQVDDDKHYFVELPKDCVEVPESLLNV